MREDYDKTARDLISFIVASEDDLFNPEEDCIKAISDAILTQVAKARAEQREKIAVYLEGTETWEGREFAKAIRNKLNQQGE